MSVKNMRIQLFCSGVNIIAKHLLATIKIIIRVIICIKIRIFPLRRSPFGKGKPLAKYVFYVLYYIYYKLFNEYSRLPFMQFCKNKIQSETHIPQ